MRNLIIGGIIGFILGCVGTYFFMKGEIVYVDVPVTVEVPIPVVKVETDTVYLPSPIPPTNNTPVIDSTYYKKYLSLMGDKVQQDSLFKAAIRINEYRERIEDDTLIIDFYGKSRGELLEYQVGYETKPREIIIDTTLKIPIPLKGAIYYGGGLNLPTQTGSTELLTVEAGLMFLPKKKNRLYGVSYDFMNKTINGKVYIKL